MPEQTIVAIATPTGRSGLGTVRLSGEAALAIATQVLGGIVLQPRRATLAHFRDEAGELLDEVIVTWFAAPHSATGEDVVEISTHGSPVLLAAVVERARTAGARLAEPGEFTRRAFLHGRLDLAQAEAVRDLIEAQTLFQARTAARQLEGSVARVLRPAQSGLRRVIARLEAGIDFADDDVPQPDANLIVREMSELEDALRAFAASYRRGRIVREGITLALVGRPNVGKSSLFNRLLGRERAIVTAEPGTTRDLIGEAMDWDGIPVHLMDTAGLRPAHSEAERLGIERSWQALADADLVLAVADGSAAPEPQDFDLLQRLRDLPQADFVLNKLDLGLDPAWGEHAGGARAVSALSGDGMAELREAVRRRLTPETGTDEFLTQARHAQQVSLAAQCIARARAAMVATTPHEAVLVDLYQGLRELDAITGQTSVEDILGVIFSTFCIGK